MRTMPEKKKEIWSPVVLLMLKQVREVEVAEPISIVVVATVPAEGGSLDTCNLFLGLVVPMPTLPEVG